VIISNTQHNSYTDIVRVISVERLPLFHDVTFSCFMSVCLIGAFARLNAGIVGSNPTQGMTVCIMYVYSVFVLFCV
jgi:hypothetical protein